MPCVGNAVLNQITTNIDPYTMVNLYPPDLPLSQTGIRYNNFWNEPGGCGGMGPANIPSAAFFGSSAVCNPQSYFRANQGYQAFREGGGIPGATLAFPAGLATAAVVVPTGNVAQSYVHNPAYGAASPQLAASQCAMQAGMPDFNAIRRAPCVGRRPRYTDMAVVPGRSPFQAAAFNCQ